MEFVHIYFLGLALLFALGCASLYISFKKYKKSSRAVINRHSLYPHKRAFGRREHTEDQSVKNWFKDWLADFSGELVGAFITTLIFGLIITVAQSTQQERSDKLRLVILLGSENNFITLSASEELLARGWLRDGTLKEVSLIGTNMQGLFLKGADLEGAFLNWANMKGVSLMGANLVNTNFFGADLCGALLAQTNLENANMTGVDLREADFYGANLRGTSLFQADLRGANFWFASLNDETILPDGSRINQDQDILEQLDRFTNPKNPDFFPSYDYTDPYKALENPDCRQFRPTDLPR